MFNPWKYRLTGCSVADEDCSDCEEEEEVNQELLFLRQCPRYVLRYYRTARPGNGHDDRHCYASCYWPCEAKGLCWSSSGGTP